MKNHWNTAFRASLIGLILFSLYFGTPYFGVITFRSLIEGGLGCSIPFDYVKPCTVLGYDISPRFGLYKIPFVNILITPLAYFFAFFELIIFWCICIAFFKFMSVRKAN